MILSELALPRFEEIVEKCKCDLRQQMSRYNNGLVSLFLIIYPCLSMGDMPIFLRTCTN